MEDIHMRVADLLSNVTHVPDQKRKQEWFAQANTLMTENEVDLAQLPPVVQKPFLLAKRHVGQPWTKSEAALAESIGLKVF